MEGFNMRVFGRLVLVVLLVAMVAAPAAAGTAENPEMADECSGYLHGGEGSTRVRHASLDLCKGWFTTTVGGAGAPALQVTLEVNSEPVDGLNAMYLSFWKSGGCTYGITVDGAVNSPHPQAFSADCEPVGEQTCAVPQLQLHCTYEDHTQYFELPAGSVVWSANRLQVTVPFDGALAAFADDHAHAGLLLDPRAIAAQAVGPVHGWTAGCSSNFPTDRCFEANGDWMFATGASQWGQ